MKILNLYAGIGGNRKLWGSEHEITAIEINEDIAKVYEYFFPNDTLIKTDAHEYLLNHFQDFDFIWTSPPCQSHSSFRHNICARYRGTPKIYPDMRLYQEIIFLKHNFKGNWIVENVKPYYEPLIKGTQIQRHLFWSNKEIKKVVFPKDNIRKAQIPDLQRIHGFDLSNFKLKDKRQILRNCVSPEVGLYVFDQVK